MASTVLNVKVSLVGISNQMHSKFVASSEDITFLLKTYKIIYNLTSWRGVVDTASASGTEGPGFESRQSTRFLGKT
jgi:hypothetical protein